MMEFESGFLQSFLQQLPEKLPAAHKQYASWLGEDMQKRQELILDFNGLQASLDPVPNLSQFIGEEEEESEQKFKYEVLLTAFFNTQGVLPNLKTFKLRGLERAVSDFPFTESIKQLYALTELDLAGNNLSIDMQENLQLWALRDIRILKLDKTHLNQLPPSVGRLSKLEHLSLSGNNLTDLPITLGFCQNIKYLNLACNKFCYIPGVVLHLKKLKDLRRLDNPLKKRWEGLETFPHMSTISLTPSKKRNADSLQALSARTVMTMHVDYWSEENLPPLQCKMLDSYASQYTYCENCYTATSGKDYAINIMIPKFVDLRDVPFKVYSCGNCCNVIKDRLSTQQKQLVRELDEEYEANLREAQRLAGVDITTSSVSSRRTNNRQRNRTKKCVIM